MIEQPGQLDRVLQEAARQAVREFLGPHQDLETLLARVADAAASKVLAKHGSGHTPPLGFEDPARGGRLLIPVPQAAHIAGIGASTMWDLIRQGLVETATLGRRRLVVVESLEKLIEQRRAAPKAPLAAPPVGRGRRRRRAGAA